MSNQKKGPDPLNRLFDAPPGPGLMPLPPVDHTEEEPVADPTNLDAPRAEPQGRPPRIARSMMRAERPTLSPVDEPLPQPAPPAPALPDPAPQAAPQPTPLPAPQAAPPEPAPPPPPASPGIDPKELAKMLAKAAAARAKAAEPAPAPQPAPPPAQPASRLASVPPPAPAQPAASRLASAPPPVAPAQPQAPASRLAGLASIAPPPARKKSAAEVLEELQRNPPAPEPVRPPAPAQPAPPVAPPVAAQPAPQAARPADAATSILLSTFPATAGFQVVSQLPVNDREVQKALWRGHRARFFATGAVEHAVAASAVLAALGRPGPLSVAKVAAGGRDWLVWVDVQQGACIAALPDAGLWFNGL